MSIPFQTISDFILSLGFDDVGFTNPTLSIEQIQDLKQGLTSEQCGDMDWLEQTASIRLNPLMIFPQAQTAIVVASHLGNAPDDDRHRGPRSKYKSEHSGYGQIAQYAQAQKDYHIWMKKRLKQACRWLSDHYNGEARPYVDTAPIAERQLAANAGLGWIGKHTLLVSPSFGSKLMLGVILTDLDIEKNQPMPNRCGHCNRCQKACPTNALDQDYQLNIPRCISYLTIEHKGEIESELQDKMGSHIFGCDECISICPYNKKAPPCKNENNMPRIELSHIRLDDMEKLSETEFRDIFSGTPLKRTGFQRVSRNVKIAKKNQKL